MSFMEKYGFVAKVGGVTNWTIQECQVAVAGVDSGEISLDRNVYEAAKARVEAARASAKLAETKGELARQKRLMLSFVDTSNKPSKSIDVRSVKHSVQDAAQSKEGSSGISLLVLVGAYEWLVQYDFIEPGIPDEFRPWVVIVLILFGGALFCWKLIEFLMRKWHLHID